MSEVSITEVNITEDWRKGINDRRSGKDRRQNNQPYKGIERRSGEDRRKVVRRQLDVDKIIEN